MQLYKIMTIILSYLNLILYCLVLLHFCGSMWSLRTHALRSILPNHSTFLQWPSCEETLKLWSGRVAWGWMPHRSKGFYHFVRLSWESKRCSLHSSEIPNSITSAGDSADGIKKVAKWGLLRCGFKRYSAVSVIWCALSLLEDTRQRHLLLRNILQCLNCLWAQSDS